MCELTIQERALNHNIRLVRREAGDAKLIGVVKGNGYGLGLAELASRLVDGGVRTLAVSELSDALKLRCYGIPAEIMLLPPPFFRRSTMTASEFARKPMAAAAASPISSGCGPKTSSGSPLDTRPFSS